MKAAVLLMGPRGFRVLGAMGLVLSCGTAGRMWGSVGFLG